MSQLWVEKYRPQTFEELTGNKCTLLLIKSIIDNGNMPNLILTGPPGTGKTSTIYVLAKTLFNFDPNAQREWLLELNASDDRGIDIVRDKIKTFSNKKTNLHEGRHKIVILDEADSMTSSAQQALRRIMEKCSHNTRFAFSCNDSSKIIEPIQSRCSILRFSRMNNEDIEKKIKYIIQQEDIKYSSDGIRAITETCNGDVRKAIINLQAIATTFGKVSSKNVYKLCQRPSSDIINKMLEYCLIENREDATECLNELYRNGNSSSDILTALFDGIKNYEKLSLEAKIRFIAYLGEVSMRISEGSSSSLQLEAMLSKLIIIYKDLNGK